MLELFEEAFL